MEPGGGVPVAAAKKGEVGVISETGPGWAGMSRGLGLRGVLTTAGTWQGQPQRSAAGLGTTTTVGVLPSPAHIAQAEEDTQCIRPSGAAFNYERCKMTRYKTWKLLYTKSNL